MSTNLCGRQYVIQRPSRHIGNWNRTTHAVLNCLELISWHCWCEIMSDIDADFRIVMRVTVPNCWCGNYGHQKFWTKGWACSMFTMRINVVYSVLSTVYSLTVESCIIFNFTSWIGVLYTVSLPLPLHNLEMVRGTNGLQRLVELGYVGVYIIV